MFSTPEGWLRNSEIGVCKTSAIPASEDRDGAVSPRSTWLMNPTESPAASATACIDSPSALRRSLSAGPRVFDLA